jgi:hypothetical protein
MASVHVQITGRLDTAKWQCQGCGAWLSYSTPVELGASLDLVRIFKDAHRGCPPGLVRPFPPIQN